MKTLFQSSMKLAAVMVLLCGGGGAVTAHAQGARLQIDQLDSLANRASETVDVKFDEHLMQTLPKLFGKDDEDIKEILKGLKGIYVKSFEFEKEGQYSPADVESVMSQLRGGGWSKIVGVRSKKDGDNVDVYLMMQGDQIQGLAVVSAEPKEFTVVNIVGPVNLEKLTKLEGQFGVPDLGLDQPKPKKIKLVP